MTIGIPNKKIKYEKPWINKRLTNLLIKQRKAQNMMMKMLNDIFTASNIKPYVDTIGN